MKKITLVTFAFAAMIAAPPTASNGEENGYHAVWLTGNYAKGPHPCGGGFGARNNNFGVEASFIGTDNYPSDSVYVVPKL